MDSLREAHENNDKLVLLNEKMKAKTGMDVKGGSLKVPKWALSKKSSFLDYVNGGLQVY
jgi:hypothetical protein